MRGGGKEGERGGRREGRRERGREGGRKGERREGGRKGLGARGAPEEARVSPSWRPHAFSPWDR